MKIESIKYSEIDYDKIPQYAKKLESIFQYNTDINHTAYLNWRVEPHDSNRRQFVVMGEAFFDTAYNLIQQCLRDNTDKKADSWIFPILFDIVHGTEVYLKAINAAFSVVLNKQRGITEGGHDLKALCATARKMIIEYKTANNTSTAAQMLTAINYVQKFIENIYEKTDDMTFARYPLDKGKNGHFYIQTLENEVIDLELLSEQIKYLYRMLEFIYDMPEIMIEINNDAMMEQY